MSPGEVYGLHAQKQVFCMREECVQMQDCAHRVDGRPCWTQVGTMAMAQFAQEPVVVEQRNDLLLDASPPAQEEREWTYVDLMTV